MPDRNWYPGIAPNFHILVVWVAGQARKDTLFI